MYTCVSPWQLASLTTLTFMALCSCVLTPLHRLKVLYRVAQGAAAGQLFPCTAVGACTLQHKLPRANSTNPKGKCQQD